MSGGDQIGDLLPAPDEFDFRDTFGMLGMIAAGVIVVATLIVTVTWWMGADGVIRPALENSPLTGAVATSPDEDGNPVVVIGVIAAIGVILLIAISCWRRRLASRALRREGSRFAVWGVTVLRTAVLLGTVSLLPVAGSIAAAKDLEPDSGTTVLDSPWQITIVAIFFVAYTWLSTGRAFQKAIARLPAVEPAADGTTG